MKVLFLLCVLLISEVWTCPGLFGGGGGGGGCCCGGCGRKKRAISEESGIYVGGGALSLEAPLRSENEIPCPQKKWKSLMNQHMKDSADGIQAKYKIQNAMEAEFGERLFVACGEGKPTFLASGDGYCSHGIEEKKMSCLVVAMLA